MPHPYTKNLIHLVFSTKDRIPSIPSNKQDELWKYIVGIGANHGIQVISVGGMPDHVHILYDLPKTIALMKSVQPIKSNSSRWMRESNLKFEWQEAYGAFGVSESNRTSVIKYITDQEHHHKRRDFKAEFVAMLRKHKLDYDPRWTWS